MKRFLCAVVLAVAAVPAVAADVGVSINIGQPGYYGRLDIGNYPQPQLVYAQPVIIQRAHTSYRPIYLHVPPGHAKNWRKYCGGYGACGRPVYFVRDRWYNDVYAPQYRAKHRKHDGRRDHDRGSNHDRDHDRGNGHGHGKHDKH